MSRDRKYSVREPRNADVSVTATQEFVSFQFLFLLFAIRVHTIYLNNTVKCAGVIIAPFYESCTVIPTLPVGHIREPIYVKC